MNQRPVDRVSWALFRRYGAEAPYITPLESRGRVGETFFSAWAAANGATVRPPAEDSGILPDFDELASADFRPELRAAVRTTTPGRDG